MLPNRIAGLTASRVQRAGGPSYGETISAGARRSASAYGATGRYDQLTLGSDGMALYRLLRIWGSLSSLFGQSAPQWQPPDFAAIQRTLQEALKRNQVVQERQSVMNTLKTSVLREAESLVTRYYGLEGDGAPLRIVLEEDMGGAMASVSYEYDRRGRMANQQLHINMREFTPDTSANGINNHVIENDRIIAHEMTHAIMGRNMDIRSLPDWFMEGTAEYIAGGAERVGLALKQQSERQLVGRLRHPWSGDSSQYAAAYLAVRYLDEATAEGGGLRAVLGQLKGGAPLDQALHAVSGGAFADAEEFLHAFVYDGVGVSFIRSLDLSGKDPGSIKPASSRNVVADHGARQNQPLRGFEVIWPSPLEGIAFTSPSPWIGFVPRPAILAAYRRHML